MQTRRNFLKTTFLSTIALALSRELIGASSSKTHIGLQLYTVRDAMRQDLTGTMQMISRIGYTWLEAAGYSEGRLYGLKPGEFRTLAEDLGMQLISSHSTFDAESQQAVIDAHAELGVPYLVYPIFPVQGNSRAADYQKAAQRLNEIGEACASAGIRFGYHNHAFEFEKFEDRVGYDILLDETDPGLVFFQADLYWMVYAGVDPLACMARYPGRFEHWHVKDMEEGPGRSFTEVGEGVIDFGKIFRMKEGSGMKYFFVEQDTCPGDPMESIAISYRNLQGIID